MQSGRIVADRFVVGDDGRAIDLASGTLVLLKTTAAGGATEQIRWAARCDLLHALHHPLVARLVDYGALGESQRFEAWQCGGHWRGSGEERTAAVASASCFFAACRLTAHPLLAADVFECEGRPVVVPAAEAGYPIEDAELIPSSRALESWTVANAGICIIDRRADAVLADLFATVTGARPHVVSIWGPPGSGRTTAGLRAAQLARRHGFVPVAAAVYERMERHLISGRHLCLITRHTDENRWGALLSAAIASPRPHVVLRFSRDEQDGQGAVGAASFDALHGVGLEQIPAATLVAAVRPHLPDGPALDRVKRAAAAVHGRPGRFAARLWYGQGLQPKRARRAARLHSRVAEQSAPYRAEAPAADAVGVDQWGTGRAPWPAPDDPIAAFAPTAEFAPTAAFAQRAEMAASLLRKGRHASAIRQLRQLFGALSRRRNWSAAAETALALASALLRRGDAGGALAVLDEGRVCADRAGCEPVLIDVAVVSGHARIDMARLDEAETVVGTALAVARRIGDAPRTLAASLALARCLFWKGRYADAASMLSMPGPDGDVSSDLAVRLLAAAARTAVGLGDLPRAMGLVREAAGRASSAGDPALAARASCTAAFVHLASGDLDAAVLDARACIASSRAAHDPMRAMRARLLLAEADRRRGRPPSAFAGRVRRLAPIQPLPLLRARVDLLRALLEKPGDGDDMAVRHAARTGLPALSLFAPAPPRAPTHPALWLDASAADIVGILHLCQTAEDETRILDDVCGRVRQQLQAAAVAVFVPDSTSATVVSNSGARIDPGIAVRATAAGVTLAPHRAEDRLEAAAPVQYGGSTIGALAARWPLGTPYDLSRAAAVLAMAAAASAPILCAAIARRSRVGAGSPGELLGTTPAMVELRRAIDRAAAAPFAVLIEGESGTGKELVAKAIHRAGLRRDRTLGTLNCAALPDDLVEAELFGHARGAFTGAVHERAGVFEEAHGGTLLLDEVGELSPRAQAKLLRVIQEGELRRIGESSPRRVDVRIVAATNRDLRREVAEGRFRLDLLYRLDVVRLVVPPLRDRREDIALLAEHAWRDATTRVGSRAVLAAGTTAALGRYDWPGNVRELQNVLAALAVRTPRRGVIGVAALPPQFAHSPTEAGCRLNQARRTFEDRFVRAALVRCGGHRMRAAAELGVTRQGLSKLMSRLGIGERGERDAPDPAAGPGAPLNATTARAR